MGAFVEIKSANNRRFEIDMTGETKKIIRPKNKHTVVPDNFLGAIITVDGVKYIVTAVEDKTTTVEATIVTKTGPVVIEYTRATDAFVYDAEAQSPVSLTNVYLDDFGKVIQTA